MRKIIIAIALFLCNHSFAQTAVDLNPVTVTSSRFNQKITETGRSISVLDGQLFQQLPVSSLDELLRYVPGIEIQQRGPAGSQSDIVMRGGTFQQVLVLIDGLKINDPITGHFSSYIPITPSEIERIEILRGPAASVYGAEAVGGVINIISKVYHKYKTEKKNTTNIGVSGGEYGVVNVDAGFYHTGNKINFSIGALSNNADGQTLRGKNKGYYHNHTLSGSLGLALKKNWNLMLRSSFDTRDFAAQNFYTTFVSDTAIEEVKTWWNQAKLKHVGKKNTDELDIAYKQTTDFFLYNPKAIANNNKSKLIIVQYLHTGSRVKNMMVSYGGQFSNRSIVSNDRGNHNSINGAVFSSLKYSKNNLTINPSIRLDYDENYGVELLPQANASYQINKLNLRANIGRAIRSADFTERFNNYGKPLVTGGSIGNPNLGTERSWTYEAGADYLLNSHIKFSATYFYRNQDNVIDWVRTPYADMPRKVNLSPTGTYSLSKNIKQVNTGGLELDVTFQKTFTQKHSFYLNTGITLLNSNSSDSVPSFYILSHAKTLWQTNIIYQLNKFQLSLNTIFKDRNEQKASAINAEITKTYFLANARLQYTLTKNWQIFSSVNNITDKSYSDLLGSKMPGRWTSFGIRFRVN